ncbi:MAG: hypothetical protein WCO93_06665 [bacterium]
MLPGNLIGFVILARTAKDSTSFDPSMLYLILALVGFFILILLLIFLRKRLFPLFRLAYLSMVYGKYSYEFLEFFKENDLRSPHNNCIKDEITMHFYCFYKRIRNAAEYKTKTNIEFGQVPFLTLYKQMLRSKGSPQCVNVARFSDSRVNVLGYHETMQGMKMKAIHYFIDNLFIMGEYSIPELHKVKTNAVNTALAAKYLNGVEPTEDVFYITDPSGNQINFENNGFSINVRYLFKGNQRANDILNTIFSNGDERGKISLNTDKTQELLNRF